MQLLDVVLQLEILRLRLHHVLDKNDGVVQRYSFLCLFSMDDTCDPFLLDCSQTESSPERLMMIIGRLILDNFNVLPEAPHLVGEGVEDDTE